VNAKKMAKHFELDIADGAFAYRRRTEAIAQEAALDGLYVIRTSVGPERLDSAAVVETYKRLSAVERDFRALKGDDLAVRPIFHWREDRVRAHLFVCFLAAYVRWHLEAAWAPLLFRDETPPARTDPVAPPERSPSAIAKEREHRTPEGFPVHSFATLLAELATLTRNRVVPAGTDERAAFEVLAEPTPPPGPGLRAHRGRSRERVVRAPQPRKPDPRSDLSVQGWKFGSGCRTGPRGG
jgi:hypothetical protein